MKGFLVVLIVLGAYRPSAAQELRSGFVVTLKGDTVRGLIRDGTDLQLSEMVTFKYHEPGSNETDYSAEELLSFGFDYGRIFKRFPGSISSADGDTIFVFAKKILEGKINLYTRSKKTGSHPDMFLINSRSGRTVHLREPEKLIMTDENGSKRAGESFKHLGLIAVAKEDSAFNSMTVKKIRYAEKTIRNDIHEYNKGFKNFPASEYHPRVDYSYSVVAGMPVKGWGPTDVAFRVAIFRHKNFPESPRGFSVINGISYRYWESRSEVSTGVRDSNWNFRQQWISLVPIGLSFQADSKAVKPYAYIGPAVAVLWATYHRVVDYAYEGNRNEVMPGLTLNAGAGVKVKTGSGFLVAEVSPTGGGGVFGNVGYCF